MGAACRFLGVIPTTHLLAFCITAFVVIAIPGPSVIFVVSRSLTFGRTAGLASVAGNSAGVYIQVIAVAIGIGALVSQSIEIFTAIKLAGAAYLVYLGVQSIRHRRGLGEALAAAPDERSTRRHFGDAMVVGIANPKAIVFFAAILTQFVDKSAGHVPVQMLILGAIFCLIGLLSDGLWALTAATARGWLVRSSRRLELIRAGGGIAMIAIGVRLALTQRGDA
jgi:threonine/homoserine/homoserine lactone efflux protein